MTMLVEGHWLGIRDGDPRAVVLYQRHYSANPRVSIATRVRYGISGPGQTMTLLTQDCLALFIWQHNTTERYDHQRGVNCTVFRNESPVLSSLLIEEACDLAWQRWPEQRLFTYVWDAKVKSVNPGYCFKMAGFKYVGRNKDGRLSILEHVP